MDKGKIMNLRQRPLGGTILALLTIITSMSAGPQTADCVGDYRTKAGADISILRVELGLAFFHFGTGRFGVLHRDAVKPSAWYAGPGAAGVEPREIEIEFVSEKTRGRGLIYRDLGAGTVEWAAKGEPYRKVEAEIAQDGVKIKGTISFPHVRGSSPAVVLVHGGGPGPRSALEIWSNMYNRLGFACLTYDKREKGSGYSAGPYWKTFEDLGADAAACADYLRSVAAVDKNRIGMAAFSQGGWPSALAAARTRSISFLILISCPVTSPAERDRESAPLRLRADGFSQQDIAEAAKFHGAYDDYAKGLIPWTEYKALQDTAKNKQWFPYVEFVDSPIDPDDPFYRSDYGRFYDPGKELAKLRIPVLAIYGQNDTTVSPLSNSRKAAEFLKSSHEKTLVAVLPLANHSLIRSESGSDKELASLNTYVRGYFELVKIWLRDLE